MGLVWKKEVESDERAISFRKETGNFLENVLLKIKFWFFFSGDPFVFSAEWDFVLFQNYVWESIRKYKLGSTRDEKRVGGAAFGIAPGPVGLEGAHET